MLQTTRSRSFRGSFSPELQRAGTKCKLDGFDSEQTIADMDNKTFFERTGGVLIVLCIIALLGAFFYSCILFVKTDVQDVKVQIVLQVDSTGVITPEALQQAEELQSELLRHEQLLEDRYNHVLEQKENLNDLLTIGGMFLTIILALFGFFGYKSINSIEEKVKKEAETTADRTAQETSRTRFESFEQSTKESLKTEIDKRVKASVDREMAESKKVTKDYLESYVKEQVKDVAKKVEDADDIINGLTTSMGNLDQKLSNLSDRVRRLEKNDGNSMLGRRTLANGGKKS